MKTSKLLFMVRHAKSSWKDLSLDDHDRPLNKRGKRDAVVMGKRLSCWGKPGIIISSTATRASRTAEIISTEMDYKRKDIEYNKKVYLAGESQLFEIVRKIDNSLSSAMILGHNPEFTNFVNRVTDSDIDNIPTCGAAIILIESGKWSLASEKNSFLIAYDYPKRMNQGNNLL